MNRRQFVASLGSAAAVGVPAAAQSDPAQLRSRASLNGIWRRSVNGTPIDEVEVPSSLRPSGYYRLSRGFRLPKAGPGRRAMLRFEAVNYHGRVFVNGTELGTTCPYVPHEFDFTAQAREENTVEVAIADLCPEPGGAGMDEVWLGLNPGWEGYGGIIRDVYVETRPPAFIENARLAYELSPDYRQASCRATVFVSSTVTGAARVSVSLLRGSAAVARAEVEARVAPGESGIELAFPLKNAALWSPEDPNLYTLSAALECAGAQDRYSCRTGFRDLKISGRDFLLNGRRIVLNGVCRHDMWKDQGFTLTRRQMEQDMRAIKALGANYVRLVHYPHDRRIVELADELGLLVSEEPGFWGMDFKTMPYSRAELGLRILERTIRRDWNSPSVMAWLLGNEANFTVEYLKQGKAMCLRLDPLARPVSIANSMKKEDAKPVCEQAGMDFFDDHPYTFDVSEFDRIAAFYGPGKPLLFTEWGGREIGQSEIVMPNTVDRLLDLMERGELAGHAFWSWQDLPEFSRIDPEMRNGILESGVVTEAREPREFVHLELTRLFGGRRSEGRPASDAPVVAPLARAPWSARSRLEPVDLTALVAGERGAQTWADFESRIARHWGDGPRNQWERTGKRFLLWEEPEIRILGVRFVTPVVEGRVRPIVLTPEFAEVEIPVGRECAALHFLGHVSWPGGYPLTGTFGEGVASYEIRYTGGNARTVPLRSGIEVAAANIIHSATRTDPVAIAAQRAFWFAKDWAREQYQGLLFSLPVEPARIESVRWRLKEGQAPLLLFAVSVELA
jgi:hypothetical protein